MQIAKNGNSAPASHFAAFGMNVGFRDKPAEHRTTVLRAHCCISFGAPIVEFESKVNKAEGSMNDELSMN